MNQHEAFAAEVVPLLAAEVAAVHAGDIGPRLELWSRGEPVTLLGAWLSACGWTEVEQVFDNLANTFHGDLGTEFEVLSAEADGDLGYVVGLEHTSALVGEDRERRDYTLRVTTILRREDGRWRIVHRHGDEVPFVRPGAQG
ncbi:ketosteroid isomerase-like protein [Marmoricola sp. URHA0025 HA25]